MFRKLRTIIQLLFLFCATRHDTNAALFLLVLKLPCFSSWILSAVLSYEKLVSNDLLLLRALESRARHDCAFLKACARVYLHTLQLIPKTLAVARRAISLFLKVT